MLVADFLEAAGGQKRLPAGPPHVARRHERRAVAVIVKQRRERRALDARIFFGEIAEPELGIDREQQRCERIRAPADVGVHVLEHESVRRLGQQIGRCVVQPAERGPSLGHRLEHDQDHVRWARRTRRTSGAAPDDDRRLRALTDRLEVSQLVG